MGSEPRAALPYTTELEELLASAQRTALESTHGAVTIEHLLLAFVDAPSAKRLLQLEAAPLMTLRGQLVSRLMQATGDPTFFGRVPPPDPALTAVLKAAEVRARSLGERQVDPGSVVASLIETGSPVADWLRDLGVTVPTPTPSAPPAEDAPPPPARLERRGSPTPGYDAPPPPPLPPAPLEDEDTSDGPTEESVVSSEAPGDAELAPDAEPVTDHSDDDDLEEWAAPTKVAGGLERSRRSAEERPTAPGSATRSRSPSPSDAPETRDGPELPPIDPHLELPDMPDPNAFPEGGESFAEHRPSLEPAPWSPGEFEDEIPTVNRKQESSEDADLEPTRVEPSGIRRRPAPSLVDETLDFDEESEQPPVRLPGTRELSMPPAQPLPDISEGQLVENIPRRMRVDRPETIQVRLGRKGDVQIARGLQGEVQTHELSVTQAMSARLVAPDGGFRIELMSPETQWIDDPSGLRAHPAEWTWTLTPTLPGKKRLQLVVGARTVRDGIIADAALPMQIIEVEVSANHGRTLVQAAQWLLATLVGGVLGVFSEEILKWAQGMVGPVP